MSLFKSLLQIDLQVSKVAGRGLIAPTDQDIVETGGALFRSTARAASRRRRLARLRATAFPTFFEHVNPTRMPSASPSPRLRYCRVNAGVDTLRAAAAARKSARLVSMVNPWNCMIKNDKTASGSPWRPHQPGETRRLCA